MPYLVEINVSAVLVLAGEVVERPCLSIIGQV